MNLVRQDQTENPGVADILAEQTEEERQSEDLSDIVARDQQEGLFLEHVGPVEQKDWMGWLDVRGFHFVIRTSGNQDAFGTRFALYKQGKLMRSTPWHFDRTEAGKASQQEVSILYRVGEEQIEIWRRLPGAAGKVFLNTPSEEPRLRVFLQNPRLIHGFQIPLAVGLAPDNTLFGHEDFDPQQSYLILVMELMERSGENPLP